MQNALIKDLQDFFSSFRGSKPLLLGISGGSDSMALYQLVKKIYPKELIKVAHIDHSWRDESAKEAACLKEYFDSEGVEVFVNKLNMNGISSNLEDHARIARYQFFQEIYTSQDCQALVLAHHRDDHVETILKRVLEGASIDRLYGIQVQSSFMGMQILRPLINLTKRQLEQIEKPWFLDDPSNRDERFLRARMRSKMIPAINTSFGKNIDKGLCRLAKQSSQLNDFMQEQLKERFESVLKFSYGWALISPCDDLHPYAISYLIKDLLNGSSETLSSSTIELICKGVKAKAANQWFYGKKGAVYQDRGRLFYFTSMPIWTQNIEIEPGQTKRIGPYEISFREMTSSQTKQDWIGFFSSSIRCEVPLEPLKLTPFHSLIKNKQRKSLDHLWTNQKVPACLRYSLPIALGAQNSMHELLSIRTKLDVKPTRGLIEISYH